MGDTEPGRRPPKRRSGCLSSLLVPVFVALALFLSRNAIATSVVDKLVTERGVECDGLAVALALTLDEVRLDPVSCELADSRVSELSFPEGASIELSGWTPSRVTAPVVEATLAASAHDAVQQLSLVGGIVRGADSRATSLPERMQGYLDGLARLASHDGPRIEVERLVVTGAPGTDVEVEELVADVDQGALSVRATALQLPSHRMGLPGVAEVVVRSRISGPTVTASQAEVEVAGTVEVEGSVAGHALERGAPFRVTATNLDTDSPSYALDVER